MKLNLDDKREGFLIVRHSGIDNINEYYTTIGEIGTGSFGTVYKMICLDDNEIWAAKKTERNLHRPMWETQILSSINHKNIIFVKELIETDNFYYLIMEFCGGGSLAVYSELHSPQNETDIRHIMIQFGEAVKYLHDHNIVHRDLKMDNLLLKNFGHSVTLSNDENKGPLIKIIDFGLSFKLKRSDETMMELCGTPLYMPPEMVSEKSYTRQCDIWSMGIVMLIMMLGRLPFLLPETLKHDILNFDIVNNPMPEGTERFSAPCVMALKGLLHPDPSYRRTASEFLHTQWFTGKEEMKIMNILEMMKKASSANRMTESTPEPQFTQSPLKKISVPNNRIASPGNKTDNTLKKNSGK